MEITILFDVECDPEQKNVDDIGWAQKKSSVDKLYVFSYKGQEGCIFKELESLIYYNRIKAPI
jgi:hypothetical protein